MRLYYVLISLLILVIMLGISNCPAFPVTIEEKDRVFTEARYLCKVYRTTCNPEVIQDDRLIGETGAYGRIFISTGMIKRFNVHQLRATVYHEVGHVVFRHVEKTSEYLYICGQQRSCNPEYFDEMRRKNEYQADRFASYVLKFTNRRNELPEALLILTPPADTNKTFHSHPSTTDRIKQIRNIIK